MSRSICIISGKGGVGKTTTAINLSHHMNKHQDTLLVDANLTTPNVNIHLGAPILRNTLMDVLKNKISLEEAIYTHESGLKILPIISSMHDLKKIKYDKLKETLYDLRAHGDIIIVDAAAGLGREAISALEVCDEVLIITNPELSAVLDAQKTVQVAQEIGKTILGVIIANARLDKHELTVEEVEKLLDLPVIGVVPFDKKVRLALHNKKILSHAHPKSKASKSYEEITEVLLGEKYMKSARKHSMFRYIMKGLGFK